jgi:hypothetical protein
MKISDMLLAFAIRTFLRASSFNRREAHTCSQAHIYPSRDIKFQFGSSLLPFPDARHEMTIHSKMYLEV